MSELGLREVVAMGVGGIIGGGIFAVLGVAARLSGNAAFLTYLLAGIIALISGYSYYRMTERVHEGGGSFTFLEHFFSNPNIAGMVGWILLVGYIGTMAMYAYAFGAFSAEILGFSAHSLPRAVISVSIIAVFIGINFLGAEETGSSEDLLVYAKILILGLFSITGLWIIFSNPEMSLLAGGVFNKGAISPIVAIGAVFVSFEGFQLLTYEYREMENGIETLKKGMMLSIGISTLIYVLVAAVTTSLMTPGQIIAHKETALAFAASQIFSNPVIEKSAVFLVSIAALFSTGSAINATLFGTAKFSGRMANDNELPDMFSFRRHGGVSHRNLIVIGSLTSLFTFLGSLEEITTFASIAFISIFSIVNLIAFRQCEKLLTRFVTGTGFIGTSLAFILLIWHLYVDKIHLLVFVSLLFVLIFLAEFIYFERQPIERELEKVEEEIEGEIDKAEEEL